MRKILYIISCILLSMLLMTGCGIRTTDPDINTENGSETENDTENGSESDDKGDEYQFLAEIIEAGDYLLVTPAQGSSELRSSDRISVGISESVITGLDGSNITLSELKPGDLVIITYNGMIAESYPAQITASAVEVTGRNQLLDGYLAIIDDIWQQDQGLNSEIEMIAVDTTGWVGLTAIDKEIILATLKETYGYDVIEGTFEELSEQGIIDEENLYFTNGVHIVISEMKVNETNTKITYKIKKWRSGLGAIGSDDATAKYEDEAWTISMEGMWIS